MTTKEFLRDHWHECAAVVAAFVLGVTMAFTMRGPPAAVVQPQVASVAPEIAKVPTEIVTPKAGVKVYKAPAKTKLAATGAIPATVAAAPAEAVVASSRVEASERPTTVTTVLNTDTGESTTYVAPAVLPWIAVVNRGSLSVAYGPKFDPRTGTAQLVLQVSAHQELLQLKAVHVGGTITGYSDGTAFIGITASYRW